MCTARQHRHIWAYARATNTPEQEQHTNTNVRANVFNECACLQLDLRYCLAFLAAAAQVAQDELRHMVELCDDQEPNTLLTVARELTEAGVKESFRMIEPRDAGLDSLVHPPSSPLVVWTARARSSSINMY